MTNEILQKTGTQIRFCVSGSYSPADSGTDFTIGSPTNVTLTLSGLADGAGRQSDKCDLGATRAALYDCLITVDFTGETPTAGEVVRVYWAPSTSGTQANGNIAGNSGADAACPGGALGSITLAEFLKQCQLIGHFVVHDGAVVQNGWVGTLSNPSRYGQIIVVNESGDAFEGDNVEMGVFLNPVIEEVQDAP